MDADMNNYDVEHVITGHPRMSSAQWERIYQCLETYYTPAYRAVLRRAAATGGVSRLATMIFVFSSATSIEGLHPLQSGILRLKHRTDRRPGFAVEPAWRFYPRFIAETLLKHVKYLAMWLRIERLRRKIRNDPARWDYRDRAMAPVEDGDVETLELFTHNEGARSAVQHARRIKAITAPRVSAV